MAPSTVVMEGDVVLIRHCWTERRHDPAEHLPENASEAQTREALNDYGLAIANWRRRTSSRRHAAEEPRRTRYGRVVFYDYDEICYPPR
ncbi:bifunctional isocitrate dehydrogenase kinase/phosphatase [Pseudomonas aeruginosa]|nr:bifunctional isocitrate dehydrogenase kinase/phosphatase [Pseudomonas aeruginosa]